MKCDCCGQDSEYLQRINAYGEKGIFYCEPCYNDREQGLMELVAMSKAELDLVEFTKAKWICSGKGCNNCTGVRDYGIDPVYYSHRFTPNWFDLSRPRNYYMCAKHWKFFKQLRKSFPVEDIEKKLFDLTKPKIIKNG